MTIQRRLRVTLLTAMCLAMCLCTTAFADTDGTEPKITQQPDQLVLQLGTRWAGVEFELRTDAGIFPAPIVVDESGVLTMDLGGALPTPSAASIPLFPFLTRLRSWLPILSSNQRVPSRCRSRRNKSILAILKALVFPSSLWWCFSSDLPVALAALWLSILPSNAASRKTMTSGQTRTKRSIDRQTCPQTEKKSPRLRLVKK